jgi:hypothetical protein
LEVAVLHYDRTWVIAAYRAQYPDRLTAGEQTLANYDNALFQRYDSEIVAQAPKHEIPLTPFNRSVLVYFAARSTAKTAKKNVEHACRFFTSVRPHPVTVVFHDVAPAGGTPGSDTSG